MFHHGLCLDTTKVMILRVPERSAREDRPESSIKIEDEVGVEELGREEEEVEGEELAGRRWCTRKGTMRRARKTVIKGGGRMRRLVYQIPVQHSVWPKTKALSTSVLRHKGGPRGHPMGLLSDMEVAPAMS